MGRGSGGSRWLLYGFRPRRPLTLRAIVSGTTREAGAGDRSPAHRARLPRPAVDVKPALVRALRAGAVDVVADARPAAGDGVVQDRGQGDSKPLTGRGAYLVPAGRRV